tara:strand:- start:463 stop:1251 length:789 start_codon:yes stop_codon:yes gene_type:complete
MEIINERLNYEFDDYYYRIYIQFENKKSDCDRLKNYLNSLTINNKTIMMTGNGVLTALLPPIIDKNKTLPPNKLHNKIVNYLNKAMNRTSKGYKLTIKTTDDYLYDDRKFEYWLSMSIYLIELRGKKWDFNFYLIDSSDHDFVNRIYNIRYVEEFRTYTNDKIQDDIITKRLRRKHASKIKVIQEEIDKNLFIKKIKSHFNFTHNNADYLSKKVVCDLLGLDYKSKTDIKRLNVILTDYGVGYKDQKMVNKIRGVFLCISLK